MKIAATRALSLLTCAPLVLSCGSDESSDAGSHSAGPVELEPISTTLFGERVLLFMEYPPMVRGEHARFLAHLSVLATGKPVRSGRVTLSIGATTLVAEGPKREGLFVPEGSVEASGSLVMTLSVFGQEAEESLDLGEVIVHDSAEEAARAAEASAADEPAGAVPFLLEKQWNVSLLLAQAGPRTLSERLVVPARARAPEGAEVAVGPPLAGRLSAPDNGRLPHSGEAVEVGQILGYVEPLLGAAEQAQIQALALEFDLKALDVVRALGEASARLDFATRELERISKLREHGLSTAQQLDEAERNLAVAQSAEQGARATRASLDLLESTRAKRNGGATNPVSRFPIVAPLSGTVVEVSRVQGETIGTEDALLILRDTTRVWVEGRVSEFDLHRFAGPFSAVVTFAALPGARFDTGTAPHANLGLLPTVDSESRTATLRCELPNPNGSIRVGMLAQLEVVTAQVDAAVVVPFEAIVMDQGLPTAYVMLEGELFQRRELRLGTRDGPLVEVLGGISAGERVATRGAYIVKLAALSPASMGSGHQH